MALKQCGEWSMKLKVRVYVTLWLSVLLGVWDPVVVSALGCMRPCGCWWSWVNETLRLSVLFYNSETWIEDCVFEMLRRICSISPRNKQRHLLILIFVTLTSSANQSNSDLKWPSIIMSPVILPSVTHINSTVSYTNQYILLNISIQIVTHIISTVCYAYQFS